MGEAAKKWEHENRILIMFQTTHNELFVLHFIFSSNNFLKWTLVSPLYRRSGVHCSAKYTQGVNPDLGLLGARAS